MNKADQAITSAADFRNWVSSHFLRAETAIPFLEALSSLEFLGAKMILRSQNASSPEHLAHHAYEEVIHGEVLLNAARGLYSEIPPDRLPKMIAASSACVAATEEYAKKLFQSSHVCLCLCLVS